MTANYDICMSGYMLETREHYYCTVQRSVRALLSYFPSRMCWSLDIRRNNKAWQLILPVTRLSFFQYYSPRALQFLLTVTALIFTNDADKPQYRGTGEKGHIKAKAHAA